MVEKVVTLGRNVVDLFAFARSRERVAPRAARIASASYCAHCGAWLAEGESEDECSSVFRAEAVRN